jgi:hypothetical protein
MGKSRLLDEFVQQQPGVAIQARPGDAHTPFAVLARPCARCSRAASSRRRRCAPSSPASSPNAARPAAAKFDRASFEGVEDTLARSRIGPGRKAWTWSARNPLRLSQSASSSMSSSVVPGCAAMKYGMRYCSLPAWREYLSNSSLKRS